MTKNRCLLHLMLFPLHFIILFSLIASPLLIISTFTNQAIAKSNDTANPTLNVSVKCMVASTIIPAYFTASGFPPDTHVGIAINLNNSTITIPPNLFINVPKEAITDSSGNLTGNFDVNVREGNYNSYILHVFVDANNDTKIDKGGVESTALLKCG